METEQIEVYHLEYVSFAVADMAWQPFVMTLQTKAACEQQALAWSRMKNIQCCVVTGPHKHTVPKVTT